MKLQAKDPRTFGATLGQRLLNRSCPEPNTGCWLWTIGCDRGGYGRIQVNGKWEAAHRMSFIEFVGPIPEGMCVCHRCDTPACMNPAHLFIGTHRENSRDMSKKGRSGHGAKQPGAKLSDEIVRQIRKELAHKQQKEVAKMFGVHKSLISLIHTRKAWAHVS